MHTEAPRALQEVDSTSRVTCLACERRCKLGEGTTGYCSGYRVEGNKLMDLTYGKVTAAQITELGWAPVSRFAAPEDKILSVGTRGCNYRCGHCVNYRHAFARHSDEDDSLVPPNVLVEYALATGCNGIACNFNEGLLAVNYWAETFRTAKRNGLYTVAVTNGYSTPPALDIVCQDLDVYRCDIKAISPQAMRAQGNPGIKPEKVLASLVYVHEKFPSIHIETVTMISPGINDSPEEISRIAKWIRDNLGEDTPWHISPMTPVNISGKVVSSPRYLREQDLISANFVCGVSMSFDDDTIHVNAGQSNILDLSKTRVDMPALQRIANLGREKGLRDVIIKTDGY